MDLRGRAVTLVLLVGITAAACGRDRGPVSIAVAFPQRNHLAVVLAVEEANAAGGAGGRTVRLVADTIPVLAEPIDQEIQRALALVTRGPFVGVIGHGGSRGSLAAAPVYGEARVPHIVPTGTSRLLTTVSPWTFPLPPNDSVEGVYIADFVRDRLRARSVVIFYVSDEYGVGLRDGVLAALRGTGVAVRREQRFDVTTNLEPLLEASLRGGAPDAIIVAGRAAQTSDIGRMLRERGLRIPVVAGDGAGALPDLINRLGPGSDGLVFVAAFWLPEAGGDASRRFAAELERRVGRPADASDAMLYDAFNVLVAAAAAVGDDPNDVREYLLSLGDSRPRLRGLTGEIGFGPNAGPPRFVMSVVQGDRLVPAGAGPTP